MEMTLGLLFFVAVIALAWLMEINRAKEQKLREETLRKQQETAEKLAQEVAARIAAHPEDYYIFQGGTKPNLPTYQD